jgi:hypothetical protein
MNIFKVGRGDFFGIIIPGAFLIINFILFIPQIKDILPLNSLSPLLAGKESIVFALLFVLSYIVGFALRLISPDYIEIPFLIIRAPYIIVKEAIKKLANFISRKQLFNKQYPGDGLAKNIWRIFKFYLEPFPYINWTFDNYLKKGPESLSAFYVKLLQTEFKNDRSRMLGHAFINQCKLFIKQKSTGLHDEIMFNEGLVRFLSGMSYALAVSFISSVFLATTYNNHLLALYSILFILFAWKLRHLRWAEVRSILSAYIFSCQNISQCPFKPDENKDDPT